jgi:enoyl-CoA hydratase/carnithine racemase
MPPPLEIPESYNTLPFSQIKLTHHAPEPSIIILTLHRPNNHNAFTTTMMHEIERAYAFFNADERVKCIVFTGQGRIFCAGADLQEGFGVGVDGQVGGDGHRDGYVLCFHLFSYLISMVFVVLL